MSSPARAGASQLRIGLSIPVIGAGVALARVASAPDTVLGFAVVVGLGVAGAGWALLGRGATPGGPITTIR